MSWLRAEYFRRCRYFRKKKNGFYFDPTFDKNVYLSCLFPYGPVYICSLKIMVLLKIWFLNHFSASSDAPLLIGMYFTSTMLVY